MVAAAGLNLSDGRLSCIPLVNKGLSWQYAHLLHESTDLAVAAIQPYGTVIRKIIYTFAYWKVRHSGCGKSNLDT